MDRLDYVTKIYSILSDPVKFSIETVQKDTTEETESLLIKILRKMKDESTINCDLFEYLKPSGSVVPRLYGLQKVLKNNVPLRLILDMNNYPYHLIAKWLVDILQPVKNYIDEHNFLDFFNFVESIKNINVIGKKMISLGDTL